MYLFFIECLRRAAAIGCRRDQKAATFTTFPFFSSRIGTLFSRPQKEGEHDWRTETPDRANRAEPKRETRKIKRYPSNSSSSVDRFTDRGLLFAIAYFLHSDYWSRVRLSVLHWATLVSKQAIAVFFPPPKKYKGMSSKLLWWWTVST